MKKAPFAEVKAELSAYIDRAKNEGPIVITQNGKAVAVLMGLTDEEDLENLLLSGSNRLQAILDESRKSIKAGKGLSSNDFWSVVESQEHQSNCEKIP